VSIWVLIKKFYYFQLFFAKTDKIGYTCNGKSINEKINLYSPMQLRK